MQITQLTKIAFYKIFLRGFYKAIYCVLFFLGSGLFFTPSLAATRQPPLLVDQAFQFSVTINRPNEVHSVWHIAPGYYLYAKRFSMTFNDPNMMADIRFPPAEIKNDVFGRGVQYEVYSGDLIVPIFIQTKNPIVQLDVDYQGCSASGFCYPPMHKSVTLNLLAQSVGLINVDNNTVSSQIKNSWIGLLTSQHDVQALFVQQHLGILLLIFLGLGLLLAFTPCVLPMIPIIAGIIIDQEENMNTKRAFLFSLTYVLGTAFAYAGAGVVAVLIGNSLQTWLQQPWIIGLASGLFVLLALSLFGMYELRMPRRLHQLITRISRQQQGGTYVGVFIMGILSTLIISPCVTAPLVGVLMYVAQTGNLVLGASVLFAMGMGMGVPLLLIGMSAGKWLPKSGPWMETIKKVVGCLMLGMAVWLFSRIVSPMVVIQTKSAQSMMILPTQSFIIVRNMLELNKQLLEAQLAHRPVILDFYADWCEACLSMDKNVFSSPDVRHRLMRYVLLRADLSANNVEDELLLKRFSVVAPPTVLFFDANGREVNSQRVVGEVDAKEFLARLNILMAASCDKNIKC